MPEDTDKKNNHPKKPDPPSDLKIFLGMIAVLVIPAYLALRSVQDPGQSFFLTDPTSVSDPVAAIQDQIRNGKNFHRHISPRGYTWSLSIFLAPIIMIWVWLQFSFEAIDDKDKVVKKAFLLTTVILIPIGFILDMVLGSLFFKFPNVGANLRIYLPWYDYGLGHWVRRGFPIEEFAFYALGFIAILSIYMWFDQFWFREANTRIWKRKAAEGGLMWINPDDERKIKFHPMRVFMIGVVLLAVAVLYKKLGPHGYHDGFPGYFVFLVALAILPAVAFFRTVHQFINWRACSFTFFLIVLISMMWEATLAIPYGWWGYKEEQMMGIMIEPWSNLPIEAALLWLAVTFTTAIVYETIIGWKSSGESFWKYFFKKGSNTR